ncbi:MAG: DNA replication/repair protein RecF [Chloroflexi bacterium]|nr:DNA replication/repair protein RecF [Chloroflexota bacterium]
MSLTNFRNYGRLELDLAAGPTLLHGNNAQGKTNLLEAIYYLATTRSPQAEQDQQLIHWEATHTEEPIVVGRIQAQLSTQSGPRQVEMRLILEQSQTAQPGKTSFRREVLVDRRKVRLMDLLGHLRVVLFLPEDIQLISGSPSQRRRYLDITLCQVDPVYCRHLADYNKILEQRNALLRQIAEGSGSVEVLPVFTERLVKLGSHVFARRAAFLHQISREAQRIHYEELTDGGETIRLHYLPRLESKEMAQNGSLAALTQAGQWLQEKQRSLAAVEERFSQAVDAARQADMARGSTSVGPHRDEWYFQLNGRHLGSYGSRGQQRTAILALKMAEINWMTQTSGDAPILLLDEVVAELDEQRRALLLAYVLRVNQALLTATDPTMFTQSFLRQAASFTVANGRVQLNGNV